MTDNYLNVSYTTHLFPEHYEAPAIYKQDGVYFMFGSQLTGECIRSDCIALTDLKIHRMVYVVSKDSSLCDD